MSHHGQNCAKGVGPSLNLRFKKLITHEGVKKCLSILDIVFLNFLIMYVITVISELEILRF